MRRRPFSRSVRPGICSWAVLCSTRIVEESRAEASETSALRRLSRRLRRVSFSRVQSALRRNGPTTRTTTQKKGSVSIRGSYSDCRSKCARPIHLMKKAGVYLQGAGGSSRPSCHTDVFGYLVLESLHHGLQLRLGGAGVSGCGLGAGLACPLVDLSRP